MIYAKQVNPEYQDSYTDFQEESNLCGFAIMGNRRYFEYKAEYFDKFLSAMENDPCYWTFTYDDLTPEEIKDFKETWSKYAYHNADYYKTLVRLLSIYYKEDFDMVTLRGSVQREWNYLIYRPRLLSDKDIERLECEYFNTGTEWIIYTDDPEEEPDAEQETSVYCCSWSDEGIKEEIAQAAGDVASAVVLLKYAGETRTPVYMRA